MVKMGSVSKITIFWAKIDSEKWSLKIYLEILSRGKSICLTSQIQLQKYFLLGRISEFPDHFSSSILCQEFPPLNTCRTPTSKKEQFRWKLFAEIRQLIICSFISSLPDNQFRYLNGNLFLYGMPANIFLQLVTLAELSYLMKNCPCAISSLLHPWLELA